MGEKEGINILPVVGGGGTDSATAMAMMNNNPWMYLVMLALFGGGAWGYGNNRGGFGGWGANGAAGAALGAGYLSNQINENQSTDTLVQAINGRADAASQLAQLKC